MMNHLLGNKKYLVVTVAIAAGLLVLTQTTMCADDTAKPTATVADGGEWFEFNPGPLTGGHTALDLRSLNEAEAGAQGRVRAKGEKLVFEKTGEVVDFWGVVEGSWNWTMSDESIENTAARLARSGVNLVRLHFPNGKKPFAENQIPVLHKFVAECKKQGIYTYLLWYCTANIPEMISLNYFEPETQALWKNWARAVLEPINPHTGLSLAKDPAVIAVELLDEDSLFFYAFKPGKPKMEILEKKYGDWLSGKYGSLDKTIAAWGAPATQPPDNADTPAEGRMGFYPVWLLADEKNPARNLKRAQDQAQFMAETMRTWHSDMRVWMREELGYDGMVIGSNWKTADERYLGPLDHWANMTNDCIARNVYFSPEHKGPRTGWSVDPGDLYIDGTILREPGKAFLTHILIEDKPYMFTEGGYPPPNRFRAEEPFLVAAYFSLQGINAYLPFALREEWDDKPHKWSIMSPSSFLQFPAAAFIYRNHLIQQGPVVVRDACRLDDIFALKGASTSQFLGLDAVQSVHVPDDQVADKSATLLDPLTFYVGRVVRAIGDKLGDDPGETKRSDISKNINREKKTVTSATGELALDYGHGIATINTPAAQGACGFLSTVPTIELADIKIQMTNEYATVFVVALDKKPLAESAKILVQIMTEEKFTGAATKPAKVKFRKQDPETDCLEIVSVGAAPILIRSPQGSIEFKRPDAASLRIEILGLDGTSRTPLDGVSAAKFTLLPKELTYLISK